MKHNIELENALTVGSAVFMGAVLLAILVGIGTVIFELL